MSVQQLMNNLLEYVVEQSKSVNPAAYNLRQSDGFKKYKADLTDLPGIECDVEVAGDHLWLQVQRLREKAAPQVTDPLLRQFVVVSQDPAGSPPKAREAALAHRHATDITEQGQENADLTNTVRRAAVAAALESLLPLWQDWSIGERPRRRTMALYGDLFALKFRLEAEESRKPWELVWGIGIAAWSLPAAKDKADAKGTDFVYPLLTQAVELSLDQQSHALSIRPRAAEPRLEFDAFSALHVAGVVEVERAAKQLLASRPLNYRP
jgi:hypothetical protein